MNCARFRFYLRSLFLSVVYIWSRGSSDYTSSYHPPVHRSHLTYHSHLTHTATDLIHSHSLTSTHTQ